MQDIGAWLTDLRPRLIEKALGYVKNEDEAEDLASECCVRAAELQQKTKGKEFPSPSSLEHWAFGVVSNLARDFLRQAKTANSEDTRESIREHETRRRESYAPQWTATEELAPAVAALPPRQREAIELHLQGFENQEIGRKMGIALATVRALRRNAHRRMVRALAPMA